jgi:hypothetical protein
VSVTRSLQHSAVDFVAFEIIKILLDFLSKKIEQEDLQAQKIL